MSVLTWVALEAAHFGACYCIHCLIDRLRFGRHGHVETPAAPHSSGMLDTH